MGKRLAPITVLITGVGAPGAPGIIQSLRLVTERAIRIVGTDANRLAAGFPMVDRHYIIPRASTPGYLPTLKRICRREKIRVLLPLNTSELTQLAAARDVFTELGTVISVSPLRGLSIANDKFRLIQALAGVVPVPKSILVRSYPEFIQAVKAFGYPRRAVCIKPPKSNGSRGIRILEPRVNRLQLLLNEKPSSTMTTLEEMSGILKSARPFPPYLVMEYLPGQEYSVDVVADHGRSLAIIPRRRDQIKLGISFTGTVVRDRDLIAQSRRIVQHLGLSGNIGFQFIRDARGIPKIIESNPRLQGTVVLCTFAGVNMVYGAVKTALGEHWRVPAVRWGTIMTRYWKEVYWYRGRALPTP